MGAPKSETRWKIFDRGDLSEIMNFYAIQWTMVSKELVVTLKWKRNTVLYEQRIVFFESLRIMVDMEIKLVDIKIPEHFAKRTLGVHFC